MVEPPLVSSLVIVVIWALVASMGWVNPLFLPSPSAVASTLALALTEAGVYRDIIATVGRALSGVILSVIAGVPLGLFLGRQPRLYQYFELPVDFLRSVPSSVLFFLFILVFGIGEAAKVAVVFYGCSLIMLVSALYGVRPTKEKADRLRMVDSFGASELQKILYVVFPDALPHIVAGIRLCVSLALVLVVVTEMFLSSSSGLGRRVYDYYLAYRVPDMYASILLLGLTGYCLNKISEFVERRFSFWVVGLKGD